MATPKLKKENAFGVVFTGYLEQIRSDSLLFSTSTKRRFVVLTHVGLHWFKRTEGYDLFGEERGYVLITDIAKAEVVSADGKPDPDGITIRITTTEYAIRSFRASSKEEAHKWVTAINTAIKSRVNYRRQTITGLSFMATPDSDNSQPLILLASVVRDGREEVLKRHIEYGRTIDVPPLKKEDELVFTLGTGAVARIRGGDLWRKGSGGSSKADSREVRARVTGGILASSLLLSVQPSAFSSTTTKPKTSTKQQDPHNALLRAVQSAMQMLHAGGPDAAITLSMSVVLVAVATFTAEGLWRHPGVLFEAQRLVMLVVALVLVARSVAPTLKDGKMGAQRQQDLIGPLEVEVDEYVINTPKGDNEELNKNIPERFVRGCFGDMQEAMRRWRNTVEWRRQFGTDEILEQPHPYFEVIKEAYPHYYCMTGVDGNPVYYERSGQVDQAKLRAAGANVDVLVWHYIYTTEFCYSKLHNREDARTITVFDVEGVGIRDLAGDAFSFLQRSAGLIQEHYPERGKVIMIVNAPSWFSFLWKMIRPCVNEVTQKKVRICKAGKETFDAISEYVDPKNIPVEYGGYLKFGEEPDSCRRYCPEEVKLKEHVMSVNKKHGVHFKK